MKEWCGENRGSDAGAEMHGVVQAAWTKLQESDCGMMSDMEWNVWVLGTHANTVKTFLALADLEGPLEPDEALRFRLAERMEFDSARSSERKERYSRLSRFGWRVK